MLEYAGVKINRSTTSQEFAGIPWKFGPKILIEPQVCLTLAELKSLFKGECQIEAGSTIVLGGTAGTKPLENVKIDGVLVANEEFNFFDHFKQGQSIEFVPF